jgi:hypothetical protein
MTPEHGCAISIRYTDRVGTFVALEGVDDQGRAMARVRLAGDPQESTVLVLASELLIGDPTATRTGPIPVVQAPGGDYRPQTEERR